MVGLLLLLPPIASTAVIEVLPHDTLPTCYARAAEALGLRYVGFVPRDAAYSAVFRLTAAELSLIVRTVSALVAELPGVAAAAR